MGEPPPWREEGGADPVPPEKRPAHIDSVARWFVAARPDEKLAALQNGGLVDFAVHMISSSPWEREGSISFSALRLLAVITESKEGLAAVCEGGAVFAALTAIKRNGEAAEPRTDIFEVGLTVLERVLRHSAPQRAAAINDGALQIVSDLVGVPAVSAVRHTWNPVPSTAARGVKDVGSMLIR